uniref:Uncharacterized protein n=1 Tax=Plectus sambesii TaxID=2011161 RepID=A0A914WSY4_9BILA
MLNKTSTNSTLIKATYATTLCEVNRAITQLMSIKTLNWPTVMKSAEGSNKEIIINCLWLGKTCQITPVWSSRGKCFEIAAPTADLQLVNVTGNKAAIKIMVDTRPLETDSVVQLLLRSPHNHTDTTLFGNDFDVQAGSSSSFAISRVTKFERIGENCGTRLLNKFINYTNEACLWEQRDAKITKQCNCRWYFSPDNGNTTNAKDVEKTGNSSLNDCTITQHFSCIENTVIDPADCPSNCYETMYEVDRMNQPLDDDTADYLPSTWSKRVDYAIERFAKQARIEALVSGSQKKLKSLASDLFDLYLGLFYEYWNDDWCDPLNADSCSSLQDPFIPFWMTESDDIDGVLQSSLFNQFPIDYSAYHRSPNKTPCSFVPDVNSSLISDELLSVLTDYNNTLRMRRESNNSTSAAIDVTLSTYDQLLTAALSQPNNATLRTASKVLQLLKNDIIDMMPKCINTTNITNYHYCFFFYNSEVLQMTTADDMKSFNELVVAAARKPDAFNNLQKQFRLYATQGLPTVLSAANLKNNFLSMQGDFEANNNRWKTAMQPFIDWLNGELYVTRTCPSVVEICTSVKQRSNDYNFASTLTFNASALNLADFVRYYSIDSNYKNLANMVSKLSKNLTTLKTSYTNFLSSLRWSMEDKFGDVLTEQIDNQILSEMFNCTRRQLDAVDRLLSTKVLAVSTDYESWISTFDDLLKSEAMGVYQRGTPYIKKSIATMTIYYRSFSVQNIVQANTYNVWTLMSDLGGTMGLYLGATVLTFFEVIAFFVHGEETIAKANFEARLRTPVGPRPGSTDQVGHDIWERVGSPKFVQFVDPANINRSVAKVASR